MERCDICGSLYPCEDCEEEDDFWYHPWDDDWDLLYESENDA